MLHIGCHLSSSKGYYKMGEQALMLSADTFQFFTRNPRGGSVKRSDPNDIMKLRKLLKENNFAPIVAHAPYTLNPCSANEKTLVFAKKVLTEDLETLKALPESMYNFHPGSHVSQGEEKGIEMISSMLNSVITDDINTTVLLETMAGKGSEVGKNFYELKSIIDKISSKNIGVCFDTCHIFDAGYDIVNDLSNVIDAFDKIIGIDKIKAIHLNDSKNVLGSRKDRHERIGKGNIGLQAIKEIINSEYFDSLPFILETPNDILGYKEEIEVLRSLYKK